MISVLPGTIGNKIRPRVEGEWVNSRQDNGIRMARIWRFTRGETEVRIPMK